MEESFGPLDAHIPLVDMASTELEKLRLESEDTQYHSFPPACLSLLKSLPGNQKCIDCGEHDPQWATVSYGALLCLNCCGKHRSLGVQVSSVRSVTMDHWSHYQVLSMLEGGNDQLRDFFHRHKLSKEAQPEASENGETKKTCLTRENVTIMRYKTKAAMFYREQLNVHVEKVIKAGEYRGREASRRLRHKPLQSRNSTDL
jgi:hypothetical protein